MQGLPQLYEVYGKDNLILMNCSVQIYYSPNDVDTANYIEKLLGNKTIQVRSRSDGTGWFQKNYSYSETARALLTAEEATRLGNKEIIIIQDNPPVMTEKIKNYEQNYLVKKLRDAPDVSDV